MRIGITEEADILLAEDMLDGPLVGISKRIRVLRSTEALITFLEHSRTTAGVAIHDDGVVEVWVRKKPEGG